MDERLKKQLDFILEVDKSKFVVRQTYLTDGIRKEDDAEHSWHIALMAILLAEYSNEPVDVLRVLTGYLISCRKIRRRSFVDSGMNLRSIRRRKPNLHM